ncbi:GNAT family N-acetyltransferase [uncultured Microbacterium sp.]|uniref:GNAT family N-acetyltransferase n=1 Tax=uncultured Microbacterium sp. TaxID=191216 RepID=UPI002626F23A|nr:GNAT family N-acetyltransferase [uncultured Microbacterium sp.]
MTAAVRVRRVRLHEWREVRDLRIEAVSDPDAAIAFLTSRAEELARDEAFWRERTAGAALSDEAAQFVAEVDEEWVASATVLLRDAGARDHLDRIVADRRIDVVGVFVAPHHRGTGILAKLFDAAVGWATAHGANDLFLDVHADNSRAQAAYRKNGFLPTGVTFTSVIGAEIEMRRPIGF